MMSPVLIYIIVHLLTIPLVNFLSPMPPTQPHRTEFLHSRPPSRIYSSSDLTSSDSSFSGFSSKILSLAEQCLNRSTYTSPGVASDTSVTYAHPRPSMRTPFSSLSPTHTLPPSRIPRPISPLPQSIAPRPSPFPSVTPVASSTPYRPPRLSLSPIKLLYTPPSGHY